ncbi:MAG: glycosyltransferase [Anaerolineales bacterium]
MSRKSRKYILLIVVLFLLLPGLLAGNSPSPEQPKMDEQSYRNNMRRLWGNHGNWTHLFIISTLDDLEYRDPTRNHLLENQHNIGETLESFYGDEAGEQFVALLEEHVQITEDMLHAAKNADAAAFEDSVAHWYANADQVAEFLHEANPDHWPLTETKAILREYLDLTLEIAVARWNGDYAADIAAADKAHDQAIEIAEMLSEGIIKQFPERFK